MNKGKLYGLRVYAKVLKRYVSLAVWYPMDGRTGKWQLYFSTDDSMDGREVLDYYRTRFQLEFCFRDGKQHAGITNSQSTDFRKLKGITGQSPIDFLKQMKMKRALQLINSSLKDLCK